MILLMRILISLSLARRRQQEQAFGSQPRRRRTLARWPGHPGAQHSAGDGSRTSWLWHDGAFGWGWRHHRQWSRYSTPRHGGVLVPTSSAWP